MNETDQAKNEGLTLPGWTCPCGCFNGEAKEPIEECRACGLRRAIAEMGGRLARFVLADAALKLGRLLLGECEKCKALPTSYVWPNEDHIIHSDGVDTGPWAYCDEHRPAELKTGFTFEEIEHAAEARVINRSVSK